MKCDNGRITLFELFNLLIRGVIAISIALALYASIEIFASNYSIETCHEYLISVDDAISDLIKQENIDRIKLNEFMGYRAFWIQELKKSRKSIICLERS